MSDDPTHGTPVLPIGLNRASHSYLRDAEVLDEDGRVPHHLALANFATTEPSSLERLVAGKGDVEAKDELNRIFHELHRLRLAIEHISTRGREDIAKSLASEMGDADHQLVSSVWNGWTDEQMAEYDAHREIYDGEIEKQLLGNPDFCAYSVFLMKDVEM